MLVVPAIGSNALHQKRDAIVQRGQTRAELLMPSGDGSEANATISEETLFYDSGGSSGKIPYWKTNLIRLTPATVGKAIEIEFSELDLVGKAVLKVYQGKRSLVSETDDYGDVSYSLPTGETASATATTKITSSSADGSLTLAFTNEGADAQGWKATVREVSVMPMTYISATTIQPLTTGVFRAAERQAVLGVKITAENSGTPLLLEKMLVEVGQTTSLADIESVAVLYSGSSNVLTSSAKVVATQPSLGETAMNQALSAGDNYFWVCYTLQPNATPGNQIDAACSAITLSGTEHTLATVNPEGTRTIENSAAIGTMHKQLAINSVLTFYDDGGPENKCSEKFKGSITFVPKSEGKKVMLSFANFDIFNTSSTGNNDVFKVYNGSAIDEGKLIDQYQNNPGTIKSTANDGALTISFEVKTGLPKSGWIGTVEEFAPIKMEVEKAEAEQNNTKTLCASSEGNDLMCINVSAINTDEAATVTSMQFSTAGSSNPATTLSSMTVMYSGKVKELGKAKSANASIVNTPNGEFTVTLNQPLQEGNNYFWLTCNIAENAKNGEIVDASLLKVTADGKEYIPPTVAPSGSRTIDNAYAMSLANAAIRVSDSWKFTDDNLGTGGKYSVDANTRTVTFTPVTLGKVAQIEFSDFDVYYAASSYGTKAKFEVYSGTSAIKSNLIWALSDSKQSKTGPEAILRSNDPSGSITVVFNPNTNNSVYAGNGWNSTVSEYTPTNMVVKNIEVVQASTETVKGGEKNAQILRIAVDVAGNLNPAELTALNLSTKAIGAERIAVYYTGKTAAFATTTLFGETTTPTAELTISGKQLLPEGKTYFWVVADVKNNATNGSVLDASLTGIVYGGTTTAPANGNPDGERIVKQELLMVNGTSTIEVSDELLFYDDGGKDKNYSNSIDGTITFVPVETGKSIKIEFAEFEMSSSDKMYIYGGKEAKEENLYATLTDNVLPASLTSPSADGALTIRFVSDKTVVKKGWAATIKSIVPASLEVDQVVAEHPSIEKVVKGAENEQLLKIALSTKGDKGIISIEKLALNISGNEVSKVRAYYTASNNVFSTKNKLGNDIEVTGSSVDILTNIILNRTTTVYLWICIDVKRNATAGNVADAALTLIQVDGSSQQTPNGNPSGSREVKGGVKGLITVGASAEAKFKTIGEAVTYISEGVEGEVTIALEPGTYTEMVNIPHIAGASAAAPITIKSKTDNAADVTIRHDSYIDPGYDKPANGVFNIRGADYLTLKQVTITTNDNRYEALAYISGISRHVTIEQCKFSAAISTTYQQDIALIKSSAENVEDCNNDFITLKENTITGGYIGVYVGGTGYVALSKEEGTMITNNTFADQGAKSIYLPDEKDATISNNRITNDKSSKSGFQAIDCYRMIGESKIVNNTIILTGLKDAKGIEMRPVTGSTGSKIVIANNMVSLTKASGLGTGILTLSDCANVIISHNSVAIQGENQAQTRCLSFEGNSTSGLDITSNLLQNTAKGSSIYTKKENLLSGCRFATNAYYTDGGAILTIGTAAADWAAKTGDNTSVVKQAQFISTTDLHLTSADGIQIAAGNGTDIDGDIRPSQNACAGADEYIAPDGIAPEMAKDFPSIKETKHNSAKVLIKANEAGRYYFMCKKVTEPTLTASEVMALGLQKGMSANVEAAIELAGLEENTEYRLTIVLEDMGKTHTVEPISVTFKTPFRPTAVSTFELQDDGATAFTDGTAHFEGFKVSTGVGISGSKKYATAETNKAATITLTNTDEGLSLSGFFVKGSGDISIIGTTRAGEKTTPQTATAGAYWKYISLKSLGQVMSISMESTNPFTIDDFSGQPLPLEIYAESELIFNSNVSGNLQIEISGGVEPYSVKWINTKTQEVISGEIVSTSLQSTTSFAVTVTDALGATNSTSTLVKVIGTAEVATFEDLPLAKESYWWGNPSANGSEDFFYSGSYSFNNYLYDGMKTWGAIGYSNQTQKTFDVNEMQSAQFRTAAGGGALGSATYAVVYAYGFYPSVEVTNAPEGDNIKGMYVANAAWTADAIANGDGVMGDKFGQGDWFKVIAKGYNANGDVTAEAEYYLADFRSANPAEHKVCNTWQWMDLRSLGKVMRVAFAVDGSRKNKYGLTIPGYFCFDNFNGEQVVVPEVTTPIANITAMEDDAPIEINLSNHFTVANGIAYTATSSSELVSAQCNEGKLTLSLQPNGSGEATIAVAASNQQLSATTTFKVTVSPVDDAPFVVTQIADAILEKDAELYTISLENVFSDIDSDVSAITKKVINNSDQELLTATINSNTLTITTTKGKSGKATITIEATSGNLSTTCTFSVTVNSTTGVDSNVIESVTIYPNPFSERVEVRGDGNTPINITIVNISGRVIFEATVYGSETIDMAQQPAGVYAARITSSSGETKSLMLIKK